MTNWMSKSIGFLGLSLILSMGPVLQGISLAQPAPAKDSKATKSSEMRAILQEHIGQRSRIAVLSVAAPT